MSKTAIITGANSGIGHEFAKVLIREGYDVHAVDINDGPELQSLGCKTSQLDVSSPDAIAAFAQAYGDGPLDLLLNVAGIAPPIPTDTLTTVTAPTLARAFAVNTSGPLLLTQALLPNIRRSASPRLGYVSSRVGSIADNSSGGSYAYRASKTALNMVAKNLAVELRDEGVVVVVLHPGIVRTNMTREFGGELPPGAVEAEEAAGKLYGVLVSKTIEETGRFWHREGQELPW